MYSCVADHDPLPAYITLQPITVKCYNQQTNFISVAWLVEVHDGVPGAVSYLTIVESEIPARM